MFIVGTGALIIKWRTKDTIWVENELNYMRSSICGNVLRPKVLD